MSILTKHLIAIGTARETHNTPQPTKTHMSEIPNHYASAPVDLRALGAKDDTNKIHPRLIMEGFPDALLAVAQVATYGANKYVEGGWKHVPNGVPRYTDALYRHLLRAAGGELRDEESKLLHHAHAAWNALAILQLILEETAVPLSNTTR